MKKKKSLIEPTKTEGNLQRYFSSIISSTPSKEKVERLLPKIKRINLKVKKEKTKDYIRRLWKE